MSDAGYSVRCREYAEAIWELEEAGIPVLQARIARWLGVSPASVSEMIRRMQSEGLVDISDEVRLTEEGRHLAAVVVRRHRLAERFLSEVLKLPWAKVHTEAEVWETMISDDVEKAMWAVMDDPKTCPHGNPIPGAGYAPPRMKPVAEMEAGETLALERISEELELDAEMMRFLDENDLRPDCRIEMVQRDPYGAVTVEVADRRVGIGAFASERLFVAVD
ncbi:MAG: metal-dependent transcriptional regulator [bacterium]|nr:metal-dependent transcriptional regulator [bacterium]